MDMTTDDEFLTEFEACRWPLNQWHHRDHVKLAYLYLCKYSLDEASVKIREGIKAHNKSHNIPEAIDRGYHETMTQAWLRLVHFALQTTGRDESSDAFYDAHPELWQFKVLRFFYSKDRFLTNEAKEKFVEPDITPLPLKK